MKQQLTPTIDDLRLECVLMQAWKKASTYLRTHSWYADTLGIDYESLRLPQFIGDIQERLQNPEKWVSDPLELVPAPKNQQWIYRDENWKPHEKNIDLKIRPLAHLSLQDQVVATAIMLCLADRVETALGDPRLRIDKVKNRSEILAYGHRLFCESDHGKLYHLWGSNKLYRRYFKDYQTFLQRPKVVAKNIIESKDQNEKFEVAIIQSDLSKFYDRVRPELLQKKVCKFQKTPNESAFFWLASSVFNWQWQDKTRAYRYAKDHNIEGFDSVALPQGLVAAGFFANVVLSDFETSLRAALDKRLPDSELILKDICYYVDDFRIVMRVPKGTSEDDIKSETVKWLQGLLDIHSPGLIISTGKTEVTVEGREKRFLVMQSKAANRIQSQVSNTFDMLHGTELIEAIEGFFHIQKRYSTELNKDRNEDSGLLVGIPDMRDDTAVRFAAGKFRTTFRSLRPLLADEKEPGPEELNGEVESEVEDDESILPRQLVLTKAQLDERAKFFSALLIEDWVRNPGNVRLLRIALDLYPELNYLEQVLKILRPAWSSNSFKRARREVRIYCLAELFRAGATETGLVQEDECLPAGVSIDDYHKRLISEARELLTAYLNTKNPRSRFPWYLMQQVFLYLSARNALTKQLADYKARGVKYLSHYWKLAKFISGQIPEILEQRAIFLVIAKNAYGIGGFDFLRSMTRLSDKYLVSVDRISPSVAKDLWLHFHSNASKRLMHTAQRLGIENDRNMLNEITLADVSEQKINPFYEEENLLQLASWLLSNPELLKNTVTPWNIKCSVTQADGYEFGKIDPDTFDFIKAGAKASHLFKPPNWCETDDERKKIQIGFLLRYALRGSTNFFNNVNLRNKSNQLRYQRPISHWEQKKYSSFQGRNAFGPPWLPLSSFTEEILFELLRWPGSGILKPQVSIDYLSESIKNRLAYLRSQRGKVTSATFLEQKACYPTNEPKQPWERPLRVGIVQSIIPTADINQCTI